MSLNSFIRTPPSRVKKYYTKELAAKYFDDLTDAPFEMMAFTNGQFSLSDLISEMVEICGKSDVDISTWTASGYDAARMIHLVTSEQVTSMRWVIDDIFVKRQPQLAREILDNGGEIRITKTHAKYVIVRGVNRSMVLRTSMNLNANPRIEYFEITDSEEVIAFFTRLVDSLFAIDADFHTRVTLAQLAGFDDSSSGDDLYEVL